MSDLDERLARALDDEVPQPPRDLDPESIRTAPSARRRRSLGPSLAAAAVVVIAVGVGLVSHHHTAPSSAPKNGPHRHAGSTEVSTPAEHGPPPLTHGPGPDLITAGYVRQLLAAAPVLPGAQQIDHSPVTATRRPMETPASANLVRRTRWWTAPGTMDDAIAFYTAHPPAGTRSSGTSTAGGPNGTTASGISFDATGRQWQDPSVYIGLELLVTVAPAPQGVAIRADADAIWLPRRTAAEHIPNDVTSVDVVVDRTGRAATVRRSLGGTDARRLAAVVDGLGVSTPGEFSCPIDFGWIDTLTFHSASGDVAVRAAPGGCEPVTVGLRSEHNPVLSGGGTVDRAVLRALGLPDNYGGS